MTTKPKAKKFRIRRNTNMPAVQQNTGLLDNDGVEDGFGDAPFPTASAADTKARVKTTAETSTKTTTKPDEVPEAPFEDLTGGMDAPQAISAIKQEGLTGRQLRMARRISQKHGIYASSDYDAVYQLRKRGIDPFQRANMLEVVRNDGPAKIPLQLPNKASPTDVQKKPAPQTEIDEGQRATEIMRIQRDIVSRRRKRLMLLFSRLAFFVLLPTLMAGFYYYKLATPFYASYSQFVIQQADPPAAGMSGLLKGTSLATSQDSISVQSYLQGREAMNRLNEDHDYIAHFSNPEIDGIQRLDPDVSKETAYKTYSKNVLISYDPTEGIIKMEVIAPDAEAAVGFSKALIGYAEEEVDKMTLRLRGDQNQGARAAYDEAELNMIKAQERFLKLQTEAGILSAEAEGSLIMGEINGLNAQLNIEILNRQELLANARPNSSKLSVVDLKIKNIRDLVAQKRADLTEGTANNASLAQITGELAIAQADWETRQLMLQTALQQMESARLEANRQTRYLSLAVAPVQADKPAYPRAFENTLLALFIFLGLYLLASLTASILREQVSN